MYHSTGLGYRLEKHGSYREDGHRGLPVSPPPYPSYRWLWSICFIPEAGMELHTGHETVALPLTKIAKSYVIRHRRSCSRQLAEDHSDLIFTTALRRGAANSPALWDGTEARGGGGDSVPRLLSSWGADLGVHPGRLASALCCCSLQSHV